jgi:hypothetical protein
VKKGVKLLIDKFSLSAIYKRFFTIILRRETKIRDLKTFYGINII